jgi:amino acid transporter
VIVTIVYILIQITAQGVLGASLVGRSAPLADVAEVAMGPVGGLILGLGVILSTFGYLCGMILAIPRALFAFARDGVLPMALSNVHSKYHTPWIAIIVQSAISLALALSSKFEPLVILANLSVLFVYLGCAAAAWQLRRKDIRDDEGHVVQPIPGSWLAPPLAVLVIALMLTSITRREFIVAGICVTIGIVLYVVSLVQFSRRGGASDLYGRPSGRRAPPSTRR